MAGYAYINPLAGLEYPFPLSHPTMLWQVMPTSTFVPARAEQSGALALPSAAEGRAKHHPLAGLNYTHLMSRVHHNMAGYAYINPLAGLTSAGLAFSPLAVTGLGVGGKVSISLRERWRSVTFATQCDE